MFLPTFGVDRSASADVVGDVGALLDDVEHVAMLLAMLGAMLLRPAEYTRHATHHAQVTA